MPYSHYIGMDDFYCSICGDDYRSQWPTCDGIPSCMYCGYPMKPMGFQNEKV